MTKRFYLLLFLPVITLLSCVDTSALSERKPVPPPSSEESAIPWNDPSQGGTTGGGQFGQLLDQRR